MLFRSGKKGYCNSRSLTYFFDVEKCKVCSRKDGCYKNGAKSRTFSITLRSEMHQRQLDFENSNEFKTKSIVRYKIEAKNAALKKAHGYDRAKSYGIEAMQLQAAVTIFVTNMKRILRLC